MIEEPYMSSSDDTNPPTARATADFAAGTDKAFNRRPSAASQTPEADNRTDATTQQPDTSTVDKAKDVARSQLSSQISSQKARAAETASGVAQSLRQAGQCMDSSPAPVGQYVNRAADELERVARLIDEKEPRELLAEAEQFARNQPGLFVGLAFATGLLASRFLRSSRRGDDLGDRVSNVYQSATNKAEPTRESSRERRVSEPVSERTSGGW